ncbi:hypothetical protein RchiOBHm_Chr1g0378801 [Rosa chinensis]|uniref:Uncharacterized protein n=1 Tax=Rosa chinensis TaxID=74649 RepID=A0A2P6SNH3_ROSCH|nr:hypothetical protein RchiOBHm_Chr1g0378801 [Rosa chinensis]
MESWFQDEEIDINFMAIGGRMKSWRRREAKAAISVGFLRESCSFQNWKLNVFLENYQKWKLL